MDKMFGSLEVKFKYKKGINEYVWRTRETS
jgi:hypothetical protein